MAKHNNVYKKYTNITKEILDSICVGDLIKINDWKRGLRVKGVTENYFVAATKAFGETIYSVCEKKLWGGIKHNRMTGNMFHMGTDGWVFGAPSWYNFNKTGEYDFDNLEAITAYLNTFELPEGAGDHSFLSPRRAVPIRVIYIKKGKEEIKNE